MGKVLKAGCILINQKNKKIALVYRQKQKDYSFPKGHLEDGESLIECAIRETAEETKRNGEIFYELCCSMIKIFYRWFLIQAFRR